MRYLEATKRPMTAKGQFATEAGIGQLVSESVVVTVDGAPAVVYLHLDDDMEEIRTAFERIRYVDDYRTAGMKTNSRTIGYLPRNTLRRDFCTATSLANEQPAEHAIATQAAIIAARYYKQWNPERYAMHEEATARVLPQYRLHGTPFTSGIINENNPLAYHFDSGNFKHVWSAMFGFKRHVEGGHLSVPELVDADGHALGFEISDKSLLLFDGQGLLHGVTPIRKTRAEARRFTVVFYSLQQMWKCTPVEDEVARIRRLRTERERKRAAGGHDPRAVNK
jgi:hypothetical protein